MSKKKLPAAPTTTPDPEWDAEVAEFKKRFEYLGQALAIKKTVEMGLSLLDPNGIASPLIHPRYLELVQATDDYAYELLTSVPPEKVAENLEALMVNATLHQFEVSTIIGVS